MSEILGLLFAVLIGTLFVPRMLDIQQASNDNTRAAITAQQQVQLIKASTAYIQDNAAALQAVATATTPAVVTVAMLKAPAVGLLPASFNATNPYNQTWEVQVLEPSAGNLQALVMSKGGTQLKDLDAARVASLVGASGGIVPLNDSGIYAGGSANAFGTYSGWQVSTANYLSITGGQLVSLLWFSSGQLVSNYLYRNQVPGQPQLNTMETPLIFGLGSVKVPGSACSADQIGTMARDDSGNVLMCDGTTFKPQGSSYWKDPVSNYANLVSNYPCDAETAWQVRAVQVPTTGVGPRLYICNATTSSWSAVSSDDAGNMTVAGTATISKLSGDLEITSIATIGAACSKDRRIVISSDSKILSCQSGIWKLNPSSSDYNSGQAGSYCSPDTYCGRSSGKAVCLGYDSQGTGLYNVKYGTVSWGYFGQSKYYLISGGETGGTNHQCNSGVIWIN